MVKVQHDDSTNNRNVVATLITQFEHPLSTLSLAVNHHSLQPGDYISTQLVHVCLWCVYDVLLVWCIYCYMYYNGLSGFVPSGLHECSVDNKGCGGEAVCLVETGVRGACVCPPLEASSTETDDGIKHITCAGERSIVVKCITGKKRGREGERVRIVGRKWIRVGVHCIVMYRYSC